MSYLHVTHPEVFFAVPRPGGLANIPTRQGDEKKEKKDEKSSEGRNKKSLSSMKSFRALSGVKSSRSVQRKSIFDTSFQSGGYVSREERIKIALETVPWVLFDKSGARPEPPNPLQDSIDILAIVISTVMLLAADYKEIPTSHLKWTLSYLECVKDEFGNCPPNVVGIINHIKSIDETLESFNENIVKESDSDDEKQTTAAENSEGNPQKAPAPPEAAAPPEPSPPEDEPTEEE